MSTSFSPRRWTLCRCCDRPNGTGLHYLQESGETSFDSYWTTRLTLAQWCVWPFIFPGSSQALTDSIKFSKNEFTIIEIKCYITWQCFFCCCCCFLLLYQSQSLLAPFGSLRVKILMTTRSSSSSGKQRLRPRVWESPRTLDLDSCAE